MIDKTYSKALKNKILRLQNELSFPFFPVESHLTSAVNSYLDVVIGKLVLFMSSNTFQFFYYADQRNYPSVLVMM